ncbi:MAG: energy transducer TonB [Acidobacteriales bacterium]|nr:energy transducer TonB [Terriglobales bacterium]
MSKRISNVLILAGFSLLLVTGSWAADDEAKRAIKSKAPARYPELASKMGISGAVRVEVTVAPNGSVKSAKALGGHPLLIDAAVSAAKNFKYEAGAAETTEIIVFNFTPSSGN